VPNRDNEGDETRIQSPDSGFSGRRESDNVATNYIKESVKEAVKWLVDNRLQNVDLIPTLVRKIKDLGNRVENLEKLPERIAKDEQNLKEFRKKVAMQSITSGDYVRNVLFFLIGLDIMILSIVWLIFKFIKL
jgi:hypothetical protein